MPVFDENKNVTEIDELAGERDSEFESEDSSTDSIEIEDSKTEDYLPAVTNDKDIKMSQQFLWRKKRKSRDRGSKAKRAKKREYKRKRQAQKHSIKQDRTDKTGREVNEQAATANDESLRDKLKEVGVGERNLMSENNSSFVFGDGQRGGKGNDKGNSSATGTPVIFPPDPEGPSFFAKLHNRSVNDETKNSQMTVESNTNSDPGDTSSNSMEDASSKEHESSGSNKGTVTQVQRADEEKTKKNDKVVFINFISLISLIFFII